MKSVKVKIYPFGSPSLVGRLSDKIIGFEVAINKQRFLRRSLSAMKSTHNTSHNMAWRQPNRPLESEELEPNSDFFNLIIKKNRKPSDWQDSTIIPIWQKKEEKNFRITVRIVPTK